MIQLPPVRLTASVLVFLWAAAPRALAEHGALTEFNAVTSRWYSLSRTEVPDAKVQTSVAPDDSAVLYSRDGDGGKKELWKLTLPEGAASRVDGLPDWKEFRAGVAGSIFLRGDKGWVSDASNWQAADQPPREAQEPAAKSQDSPRGRWRSPDDRWEVRCEGGVVFLKDRQDGAEREIGRGDGEGAFRQAPVWAPDSSRFVIWKEKDVKEREVDYVESSPKGQLQPRHFSIRYPKPGDEIDTRVPWVFFVDGSEPMAADPALVKDAFETRNPAWRGDSRRLTFEWIERGFGKHHVIEMDTTARTQRVLVREDSETFVFVYGNSFRRDLKDGEEILWMSERDGWKHLYLLSGRTGEVIRLLTPGEWVVREVVEVDEERREVLLKISGCYPEQDPYLIHYARVSIDSGKPVILTRENGTHEAFTHRPGSAYFTCRWSRVDQAPVTEVRRWEDGSLVQVLARADDAKLRATGYPLAEPFVAKDREGKFDICGVIIRPPEFDPAKKYPVVENIYAGPHDSFVPKAWGPWLGAKSDLAAFGFIVVQIDGRGTANRCREFHHYCYKNLKDAGLPDRIAWMKAAAAKYPQMDLERVGIYGGSAGGQNALGALLFHPEFYKAAAADCGCHDNRMDKIWWNEQWMDWPVGPEYADNSNVTHARNLQGALLLTVGEVDTNVDPSSTYQVIDALIAADKDFEFLPMTGKNHGAGEERYAQARRVDFFRRHLGGPR